MLAQPGMSRSEERLPEREKQSQRAMQDRMMLIESNKGSRVSLNSRSGTSSYTITPSTGIKPFMNPPSVAGGNQLSTIVQTNRG